jgi:tetratricopeptide (TPR) repeat protein
MKIFVYSLFLNIVIIAACSEKKTEDLQAQKQTSRSSDTTGLALSASLYYDKKMYVESFKEYTLLIKYDSLNGKNYYRRGYSLMQLNRHKESVSDFLRASELDYRPCSAYYNLALMYSTIFHDDSLAIEYCERCLKIDPQSEKVITLLQELKRNDASI